jgi:hypothetical protein
MGLRLIRGLLGAPGFLAIVASRSSRLLDPSVGGSGQHDFAVRNPRFVFARIFLKNGSKISWGNPATAAIGLKPFANFVLARRQHDPE